MDRKQDLTHQIVTFSLLSGLAALVNIGSRIILSTFLSFQIAVSGAYVLGMILNFILNKRFTFPDGPRKTMAELRTFSCIALFGLFLTNLLSAGFLLLYSAIISASNQFIETIAHISAVGLVGIYSFLGHKYFSYRQGLRHRAIVVAKSLVGDR
jgi:putative flippase GtrA